MTRESKLQLARLLLVTGVILCLIGGGLWLKASSDADQDRSVAEFTEAIRRDNGLFVSADEDVSPNRTPSVSLFVIGAVSIVSGVVLAASAPAPSADQRPSA